MGIFSKFFSFTQELAIDLGTANTIIISDGEIAVNEPSVVEYITYFSILGKQFRNRISFLAFYDYQ